MTDDAPRGVQLSRKKGSRLPPNTACVDRTTKWGNPVVVVYGRMAKKWFVFWDGLEIERFDNKRDAQERAVAEFENEMRSNPLSVANIRAELQGKNLACVCALDEPCHRNVLLKIANEEDAK